MKKPGEASVDDRVGCVGGSVNVRGLVRFVHVFPILGASKIFFYVASLAESLGYFGNTEIVVGVLYCSGYRASHRPYSVRIEVVGGNVTEIFPAGKTTSTFY